MAFVTGEVVADSGGETPFKIIFKKGETVLAEWPAKTQQAGEERIVAAIRGLMEEEGEEGEEDEEGSDETDAGGPSRSSKNTRD
jgi:hypothetical protein